MKCGDCLYFAAAVRYEHSEYGTCRRHPPTVTAAGSTISPSVSVTFWCGEFSSKPPVKAKGE